MCTTRKPPADSYEIRVPDAVLSAALPDWCKMVWIAIRSIQGADRSCRATPAEIGQRAGKSRDIVYKAKYRLLDAGYLVERSDGLRCTLPCEGGRYDILTGETYSWLEQDSNEGGSTLESHSKEIGIPFQSPLHPPAKEYTNTPTGGGAREPAGFDPIAFAEQAQAPDLSFLPERDLAEHGALIRERLQLVARDCREGWGFPFERLVACTYGTRGISLSSTQYADLVRFAQKHGYLQLVAACTIGSRVGTRIANLERIRERWTNQTDNAHGSPANHTCAGRREVGRRDALTAAEVNRSSDAALALIRRLKGAYGG